MNRDPDSAAEADAIFAQIERFEIQTEIAKELFCSGASAPPFSKEDGQPSEYWSARAWRAWEFAGYFIEEMTRRQNGDRSGGDRS